MASAQAIENRPLRGIALKIGAVFAFMAMYVLIKSAGRLPPGEIVFFRSFFALIPVLAWVFSRGEGMVAFRTRDPMGHAWRGMIGVMSMGLGFYGLTILPLPEAVMIGYAMPFITVVFGAVFLGETVRLFRWSAVLAGLFGVLVISWPRLSVFSSGGQAAQEQAFAALAVLGSAAFAAGAMIQVRKLVAHEATMTIVIWFSVSSAALSLLTLPFGWQALTQSQAGLLIAGGIAGGIGQIFLTSCYRYAGVSTIAPFEYVSLLLSVALGWLVFSEVPTAQTLFGGLIVVAAALFIIWREHRLGLELKKASTASLPQG